MLRLEALINAWGLGLLLTDSTGLGSTGLGTGLVELAPRLLPPSLFRTAGARAKRLLGFPGWLLPEPRRNLRVPTYHKRALALPAWEMLIMSYLFLLQTYLISLNDPTVPYYVFCLIVYLAFPDSGQTKQQQDFHPLVPFTLSERCGGHHKYRDVIDWTSTEDGRCEASA